MSIVGCDNKVRGKKYMEKIFKNSEVLSSSDVFILFGRGYVARKTFEILDLSKKKVIIVDNDPNLHGTKFINDDLTILSPKELDSTEKYIFIICSTSTGEIESQIKTEFPLSQIFVSPLLEKFAAMDAVSSIEFSLLFTSGAISNLNSKAGGGLYFISREDNNFEIKKLLTGKCYGLDYSEEKYYLSNHDVGIQILDKNFEIIKILPLEQGSQPHGIRKIPNQELIALGNSGTDEITIIDFNGLIVNRISLSNKKHNKNFPNHHINDILIKDGSIYASMFSISGNYKLGIFDGGILEFNLEKTQGFEIVKSGLKMPHNVEFIDNHICVNNSFQGEFLFRNLESKIQFPGFIRGLDHNGDFYFLGQSRNRNWNEFNDRRVVSVDSAIHVVNKKSLLSTSFKLPPAISEIHAIKVVG